ncbi:MAG TPA: DUF4867 domain-containing protein [Ruminococcus sp.]|nr:DUF4867 domain-containing protein [Ruminococcus sp.]
MLEILKNKNPNIKFYSVGDDEFKTYGRILDNIDTSGFIKAGQELDMSEGVSYRPSMKEFECLGEANTIRNELFGTLPTEIGCCWGHNTFLNATEWHTSSEVNIAVTPIVLLLGHVWDVIDDKIDSSKFTAFHVPQGVAIECFSTTLHYCPCQVSDDGFICIVALPEGTNTAIETEIKENKITAKNKWQLCHYENKAAVARGIKPGITGVNHQIKY